MIRRAEMPMVMVPYHGTMGPRFCVLLPHVLRDIDEETYYHNNKYLQTRTRNISFTSKLN